MENPSRKYKVVIKSPTNIAVVKYWGKKHEEEIIPLNASLSATLHLGSLFTNTTITASRSFKENQLKINGKAWELENNERFKNCLEKCLELSKDQKWRNFKFHIVSENNFPTAAGMASSASGFAGLTTGFAKIFGLEHNSSLASAARVGSGSACRSMYGGWVEWCCNETNSSKSISKVVKNEEWWPEIRILALILSTEEKKVGSSAAMRRSVASSEYLRNYVPSLRVEEMKNAIKERNFTKFAEITMKESNRLHAVCLDSYPPVFYLNSHSQSIIDFVHRINRREIKAAYTFDAGPNPFIFTLQRDLAGILDGLEKEFGAFVLEDKLNLLQNTKKGDIRGSLEFNGCNKKGCIKRAILTKVGPGPKVILFEKNE